MKRLVMVLAAGALVAALVPSTALAGKAAPAITGASPVNSWVYIYTPGSSAITCRSTVDVSYTRGAKSLVVTATSPNGSYSDPQTYAVSRTGTTTATLQYTSELGQVSVWTFTAQLFDGKGVAVSSLATLGTLTADYTSAGSPSCGTEITYTYP